MSINYDKLQVLFASTDISLCESNTSPEIQFKDSVIEIFFSAKYLGVTVTNLSWSDHISTVIKNCNSYLYHLSRIRCLLFIDSRYFFCTGFIIFNFCCVVWGNCTHTLGDKLLVIRLQKRTLCDSLVPSADIFIKLKWMTFPERVVYQKAIQPRRILKNQLHCLRLYF